MSWLVVWVCAVGLLVQKVVGAFVPRAWVQGRRVRAVLSLLPVSMLAALILTQTATDAQGPTLDLRLVGLGVAALALLLRAPFLLVVVLAAGATAAARLLT